MITPLRRRQGTQSALVLAALALAGLTLTGTVAGCSGSDRSASVDTPAVAPAEAERQDSAGGAADQGGAPAAADGRAGAAAGAPDQPPKEGSGQQAPQVAAAPRSLVYTGTTTITVPDVTAAANRAVEIAQGAGGVLGSDHRTLNGDMSEAQLVLRVPAARFAEVLDELGRLGKEASRAVNTKDVTEAVVDVEARLATQRASVERVRALLAKAQTIGEVVSLESELTRREAELASLEQRKDSLADQVALSTITVSLHGRAVPQPSGDEADPGFLGGLTSGWSALVSSLQVVLLVAGWALPWALAIGAPAWLAVWLLRRRRRPAAAAPPTPTP